MNVTPSRSKTALVVSRGAVVGGVPMSGFDPGMLAAALVCAEHVLLFVPNLSSVVWLLSEVGVGPTIKLVQSRRLRVYLPENGTISAFVQPSGVDVVSFGSMTVVPDPGAPERLTVAWVRRAVEGDVFTDVTITDEQITILLSGIEDVAVGKTSVADLVAGWTPDVQQRVESYFHARYGARWRVGTIDLLVRHAGEGMVPVLMADDDGRRLFRSVMASLDEARIHRLLVDLTRCDMVFAEERTCRLVVAISEALGAKVARSEGLLDTMTDVLDQPSVAWMVNRDALRFADVLEFTSSGDGRKLRNALAVADGDAGKLALVSSEMTRHQPLAWWGSAPQKFASMVAKYLSGSGAVGVEIAEVGMDGLKLALTPLTPLQILAENLVPKVNEQRANWERRILNPLPRISKLEKWGARPYIFLDVGERHALAFLKTPGEEVKWEIVLEMDDQGRKYADAFRARLPPHGTPERRLLELLGRGAELENVNTAISANGGVVTELRITYELLIQGEREEVVGNTDSFFALVHTAVPMLSEPELYSEWLADSIAALRRASSDNGTE